MSVFLHFVHDQTLKLYQVRQLIRSEDQLVRCIRGALKIMTYISTDPLIIPTSDIVQSPVAAALIDDFTLLADHELLTFVGSTVDIDQLMTYEQAHFSNTSLYAEWGDRPAIRRLSGLQFGMRPREVNTTADVKYRWSSTVGELSGHANVTTFPIVQLRNAYHALPHQPGVHRFERSLERIPDRLGEHAFLWSVVEDLRIFGIPTTAAARRNIELSLGWNWALSYLTEFGTKMAGRLPRAGLVDCGLRQTHPELLVDLVATSWSFQALGLAKAFASLTLRDVVQLRLNPAYPIFRDTLLSQLHELYSMFSLDQQPENTHLKRECDAVRSAVIAANSPVRALNAAAFAAADLRSHAAGAERAPERHPSDRSAVKIAITQAIGGGSPDTRSGPTTVLMIFALAEELEVALDGLLAWVTSVTPHTDQTTGRISYLAERVSPNDRLFQLVAVLVGRGEERAAAVTAALVSVTNPAIVASLGIAGSLSDDLSICDVAVGEQVVSYLANAKAGPGVSDSFELQLGGDAIRSDEYLVHRMIQLPMIAAVGLEASRQRLLHEVPAGLADAIGRPGFRIRHGAIASGNVVGASTAFIKWLRTHKRDYIAIDMESSGAAIAAATARMMDKVRFIALRGISDQANEEKTKFEHSTRGEVRRLAVLASIEFFMLLLDSLPRQ